MKKLLLLGLLFVITAFNATGQKYYKVTKTLVSDYNEGRLFKIKGHVEIYEENDIFSIFIDGKLYDKLRVIKQDNHFYACKSIKYDEDICMITKYENERSIAYYFDPTQDRKDYNVAIKFYYK